MYRFRPVVDPASDSCAVSISGVKRFWADGRQGLSRWRGGRFACTSLIRRWSLARLTVARYDDVNMDSDVSSISNQSKFDALLAKLLHAKPLPYKELLKEPKLRKDGKRKR